MATWLIIIVLAYFLYSLSSLGDKLVLNQSQSPRAYVFFVGILSLVVLLLIPFAGLDFSNADKLIWPALASLFFMGGLYFLYLGVNRFEVSRVVPIVGALQPVLILFFGWLLFGNESIKQGYLLAFCVIFFASLILSFEKKISLTKDLLKVSFISAILTSLNFIFLKIVFENMSFLQGTIWVGIFNAVISLLLITSRPLRQEIFSKKEFFTKKSLLTVIITQFFGGLAGFLQNLAISLAPVFALAIINALRGVQYVFLFFITLVLSFFYPGVFYEKVSIKLILQKGIAILLIIYGLAILVL